MGNPGTGHQRDLFRCHKYRVGKPDIAANPAEMLHVRHRSSPEPVNAERLFRDRLSKVRVQSNTIGTRQSSGFAHQVLSHAER